MNAESPTVVYLTAGAAGMYCGSCMNDNTLARSLSRRGIDVLLVPTYTPIRTDDENIASDRLFFNGIRVYLEQFLPGYRWLAPLLNPLVERPWVLKLATRRASSTSPQTLGKLTVSMLRGLGGQQRRDVEELAGWLETSIQPNLLVFSNMLIAGCVPYLKEKLGIPILVTLQGDDIFLDSLPDRYRTQAIGELQRIASDVDGFLLHSQFYVDFMADTYGLPREKMHQIPLGIDILDFAVQAGTGTRPRRQSTDPASIGYLARLAPEKGLDVLVDAFVMLQRQDSRDLRLRIAGYLGEQHREFAEAQFTKLREAGLADKFDYAGTVDRAEKIRFLQSLDLFSVPTHYRDPKGLYVLEALAAGVPVIQPSHGAFPELLARLGGGELVPPNDAEALAKTISRLLDEGERLSDRALQGQANVVETCHADAVAAATWECWRRFL